MLKLSEQIKNTLHAVNGVREVGYRYELLNSKEIKIDDIQVSGGRIAFNSEAVIKRTASFDVRNVKLTDWLNHRIKAYFRLKVGNGFEEWPIGIFIPSTGSRKKAISDITGIECYDASLILQEDKLTGRYYIAAGTTYITAITKIINSSGIWKVSIMPCTVVIGTDKEFEAGTSKMEIVNSLLKEINYTSLYVDENGYFCSRPYLLPMLRTIEYEYKTDSRSVILKDGRTEETDLFNTPNCWLIIASNPEKQPLYASYTNTNPASKTSTVSRGRTITQVESVDDMADQQTLDDYVKRLAYEQSSRIYNTISFNTPNMPHHTFQDCIWFEDSEMGIASKFIETEWSMDLNASGKMSHKIRRVIDI